MGENTERSMEKNKETGMEKGMEMGMEKGKEKSTEKGTETGSKKSEKERLLELIETKKRNSQSTFAGKQDIYGAQGGRRKGVKTRKQGGLFDK